MHIDTRTWKDYSNFSRYFSKNPFDEFCLAYIFTDIDFDNGTAGLANIGTICKPSQVRTANNCAWVRCRTLFFLLFQNSGMVTLVNHGKWTGLRRSALTFLHELGHNFGASHDEDVDNSEQCAGKGFIMADVYSGNQGENEAKFSPCSLDAITKAELGCLAPVPFDPHSKPEVALCGNRIVEPGEECDCGDNEMDCDDPCCYPAHLADWQRAQNATARPCSRSQTFDCRHPAGLVWGVYAPLTFLLVNVIVVAVIVRSDWKRKRRCFTHVTEGNVRIVR